MVGGLFGQSDPDAVLFILFGGTEGDESHQDEDGHYAELDVGEPVERFEQSRLSVEDDVPVILSPIVLNGDRSVFLGQLIDLLPKMVRVVDDLLRNEV